MEKTCYNCGSPISKETCEEFPEVCEHWSPKKPLTNADIIRAMTNKELAEWIADIVDCGEDCPVYYRCTIDRCCEEDLFQWLQKEADND